MSEKLWKILEEKKERQYENFVFALNQCGKFLLNASDDEIETHIFEDFNLWIRCSLKNETLELFMDEGWINESIQQKCVEMRKRYMDVVNGQPDTWTYQAVRESKLWREVMELSDEIKSMLYYIDRKFYG